MNKLRKRVVVATAVTLASLCQPLYADDANDQTESDASAQTGGDTTQGTDRGGLLGQLLELLLTAEQ